MNLVGTSSHDRPSRPSVVSGGTNCGGETGRSSVEQQRGPGSETNGAPVADAATIVDPRAVARSRRVAKTFLTVATGDKKGGVAATTRGPTHPKATERGAPELEEAGPTHDLTERMGCGAKAVRSELGTSEVETADADTMPY